ncbi:MAG: energy-coupling factor ABC transporter permease [Firmicutes bacterium]|nr:energy-coupling factor ABC transporter permease [Bacillota bacterium]
MHMGDALISPLVGGTMLAATAGLLTKAVKSLDRDAVEHRIAYMGVTGAFVFASQMINFAIPGTGSSGHIGGGMLLAILLGPHAGFLAMASILLIQALFFADGGLLAYGCNVINLGLFTTYLAYPLIYQRILKIKRLSMRTKLIVGAVAGTLVALQLGAFAVTIETVLSGRTELPFGTFLLFMQPIHLAIGLVEGVITAAVVSYLYAQKPELLYDQLKTGSPDPQSSKKSTKAVVIVLLVVTLFTGAVLSNFASASPDGLEWSIENVSAAFLAAMGEHPILALQEKLAWMPDYGFKSDQVPEAFGTSFAGIIGSIATLLLVMGIGRFAKKRLAK